MNELVSPQPLMSIFVPHGIIRQPITKASGTFQPGTEPMSGKLSPWPKKYRHAPMTVPMTTIGCRRTSLLLKKPHVVILFHLSSYA